LFFLIFENEGERRIRRTRRSRKEEILTTVTSTAIFKFNYIFGLEAVMFASNTSDTES
jgi:hypothetical protein